MSTHERKKKVQVWEVGLKTWQWVVIGALVGGLFAGARRMSVHDPLTDRARSMSQDDFESTLLRTAEDGPPTLSNIVVHPSDASGACWVTARLTTVLSLHSDPKDPRSSMVNVEMTAPRKYHAAYPYHPLDAAFPAAKTAGIMDYFEAVRQQPAGKELAYHYAWYELPLIESLLWIIGSTALIGGVWPITLHLMIRAGFGRKPELPPYDLSKFHSNPDHAPVKATATADEKCDALLALIEANEREMAKRKEDAEQTAPTVAKAPPEVRQLIASVAPPATISTAQAEKDFAGEFYPTETHVLHQRE